MTRRTTTTTATASTREKVDDGGRTFRTSGEGREGEGPEEGGRERRTISCDRDN